MSDTLSGRVAVITGIATGMGRAGAILFASEGAAVVGLDIEGDGATQTVEEIEASGGQAALAVGDAAASADVASAIALAVDRFGHLDLLWANAGIGVFKDVVETSEDEWDRIVGVNLKSAYLLAHHGIPELRRAGGGTMVMTGSVNSFVGAKRWAAYSATKGGMLMLCRAMALDHAAEGIRVNCVCPGSIETPLLHAAMQAGHLPFEEARERDRLDHPMGRIGEPLDVARAALFLCSDASSFVTGSALVVDGGFTAQ
jgi:NAD(P)-dependent dehydrogenase (short-subunit alcohol dehydrogenase family)